MALSTYVSSIELSHQASCLSKASASNYTHEWHIQVRGVGGARIEKFIEKVIFQLHETFAEPKRVIKEPPYEIRENGFGSFDMGIEIVLKRRDVPYKFVFTYDMVLPALGQPPIRKVRTETLYIPSGVQFGQLLISGGAKMLDEKDEEEYNFTKKPKLAPHKTIAASKDIPKLSSSSNEVKKKKIKDDREKTDRPEKKKSKHEKIDRKQRAEQATVSLLNSLFDNPLPANPSDRSIKHNDIHKSASSSSLNQYKQSTKPEKEATLSTSVTDQAVHSFSSSERKKDKHHSEKKRKSHKHSKESKSHKSELKSHRSDPSLSERSDYNSESKHHHQPPHEMRKTKSAVGKMSKEKSTKALNDFLQELDQECDSSDQESWHYNAMSDQHSYTPSVNESRSAYTPTNNENRASTHSIEKPSNYQSSSQMDTVHEKSSPYTSQVAEKKRNLSGSSSSSSSTISSSSSDNSGTTVENSPTPQVKKSTGKEQERLKASPATFSNTQYTHSKTDPPTTANHHPVKSASSTVSESRDMSRLSAQDSYDVEFLLSLEELYVQLKEIKDPLCMKRVYDFLNQTGKTTLKDTNLQFDLCALDRETISRLRALVAL